MGEGYSRGSRTCKGTCWQSDKELKKAKMVQRVVSWAGQAARAAPQCACWAKLRSLEFI